MSEADQQLLDEVFAQLLEAIEDGRRPDVSDMLRGHEHLHDKVESLRQLAEQVAPCNPGGRPTLSGYTIIGELGRGGMGLVYLARRESLGGRPVALKVLPASMSASSRGRRRFLAEARALAKVRHPNIVTIHDVIDDGSTIAYAMEWVDGSSLDKLIEEQAERGSDPTASRSTWLRGSDSRSSSSEPYATRVCRIGASIARALEEMHAAGLLHRDVKPSNILIRTDGTPLLTDFGLVRDEEVSLHTQAGQFIGTPAYAAPEQLRGDQHSIDARTDVYGLGVTLYHALALQRPFDGRSTVQILDRIESGTAVSLRRMRSRISRDLETIVAKAMDPNPARRYASAGALADDLERLLGLLPIRARPAGPVRRTIKFAHRNRRSLVGAIAGGVAAIVIGAVLVIYFFLVPGWVETDIRQARTHFLGPSMTTQLYVRVYGGWVAERNMTSADMTMLSGARERYASALRWQPWQRRARLEKDVVEAIRGWATGPPDRVTDRLSESCPLTARYLLLDTTEEGFPGLSDDELRAASDEDIRLLGFAAWASDDPLTVIRAWPLLDAAPKPDPLVDGGLGYLYLLTGRPELAYPRLGRAAEAYPDVPHLQVFLADAAVQCGDYRRAENLLDTLEDPPFDNDVLTIPRIRGDLYTLSGRYDEAREVFESTDYYMGANPLGWTRYTSLVEQTEGIDAAVLLAACRVRDLNEVRSYQIFYVVLAERWWFSIPVEERRHRLETAHIPYDATHAILRAYAQARTVLRDSPEPIHLALPGTEPLAVPERPQAAPKPDVLTETLGLHGVCVRFGILTTD